MKPELTQKIKTIRHDYSKHQLLENQVDKNPIKQFSTWLDEAFDNGDEMANAFTLSTINEKNIPSSRVVLLRDISYGGFTFFTNYASHKGRDIEKNKHVSLLFFWKELKRQVRITGTVSHIPVEDSNEYFQSRPRESQIAALASKQSTIIKSREVLEDRFKELYSTYENKIIPRPEHWGGYVLKATAIEFWQGRESRLHDRLLYKLTNRNWEIERLAP